MLVIHGLFRWVVVIVGVIAVVRLALGLIQKSPFTSLDRGLTVAFSVVIGIQVLLGLINLVILGFPPIGIVHGVVMILAAVTAGVPRAWRNMADQARFRNTLIAYVISLILIFIGVAMLGAWTRLA